MTSLSFFQKTAFSVHLARDTLPWVKRTGLLPLRHAPMLL
jgi:hypothetical protein